MATYRRRQVWLRSRHAVVALVVFGSLAYTIAATLGNASGRLATVSTPQAAAPDCEASASACGGPVTRPELAPAPPPPKPRSVSSASTDNVGEAGIANIDVAIGFVDGTVIPPGGTFSFDDVARSWDYKEDERYLWGLATAVRGPIWMRGGGVCWVSTAIWRAALEAGLPTGLREAHYGLVTSLGPGLDATNTLVVENDSELPVKIRVWRDDDAVFAALFADGSLGRKGRIEGPIALGRGVYTAYQHVTWDDGREHVSEFSSRYYW